jgi:hypothetical protein
VALVFDSCSPWWTPGSLGLPKPVRADRSSLPMACSTGHRGVTMNPRYHHYHTPPLDPRRKRCPVCNHAVYSLAGIHPQCAVRLADPPRPKHEAEGDVGQVERATKDGVDAVVQSPSPDRVAGSDRSAVRPPAAPASDNPSSPVDAADRDPLRATTVRRR